MFFIGRKKQKAAANSKDQLFVMRLPLLRAGAISAFQFYIRCGLDD